PSVRPQLRRASRCERRIRRDAVRGRGRGVLDSCRGRRAVVSPHADRRRESGGRDPSERLAARAGVRGREPPRRTVPRRCDCATGAPASVRVSIGRVGRPHGIDGAFFIERPSEDARWWRVGSRFLAGGEEVEVVATRRSSGRPVIRLDRAVERGAPLEVEGEALPPTDDDEYYAFQLIGLEVVEENGRALGTVADSIPGGATDVLGV